MQSQDDKPLAGTNCVDAYNNCNMWVQRGLVPGQQGYSVQFPNGGTVYFLPNGSTVFVRP